MRLWHLHVDRYRWDEYDAFVIRAETAEDAIAIANAEENKNWAGHFTTRDDWQVDEVLPDGEPGVILGSFNAG